MKTAMKIAAATMCAAVIAAVPAFAACSSQTYVTSIEKSSTEGSTDTYTIYYSDGTQSQFTVPNGSEEATKPYVTSIAKTSSDGLDDTYTVCYSDGTTGNFTVSNGADGVDAQELYEKYKEETGEDLTYAQFLEKYLSVDNADTASVINYCLQSCLKIYTEFIETSYSQGMWGQISVTSDTAVYTGSAVIYDINTISDGYTYLVTNYHVVYDNNANPDKNGGTKVARRIYGYLYGSESTPVSQGKGTDGYTQYSYGDYGIALEYVGGSVENDIAVLRVKTDDIKAVNENIKAVELADGYYVGETAIAIGNPEGSGLSVTQGIISTENENISLNIDGTLRSYRSLRIDTALYSGNSGGGLFNAEGKLIGITNAGDGSDQNINYAVPLEIVTGVADNIIYYANDGDDSTSGLNSVTFGVTVTTSDAKYVYDASLGYGKISESVNVQSVTTGSIAEKIGITSGDVIKAVIVNGEQEDVLRSFDLSDIAMTLRSGDKIQFVVERDGAQTTTATYTLALADFAQVA